MTADELRTCFAVLELPPNASFSTVKTTYRELVKVWHPDRFGDNPSLQNRAQEKLKAINLAYAGLEEAFQNGTVRTEPLPQPKATGRKQADDDGMWLVNTTLHAMRDGRTNELQRKAYIAAVEAYGSHDSLAAAILPDLIDSAVVRVKGNAKNQLGRFFKDVRLAWSAAREKSDYPGLMARWIMDNAALTPEFTQRRAAFVTKAVQRQ